MRKQVPGERPLYWVGSAKRDLLEFPEAVKDGIGVALSLAQFGGKHPAAKPWKGAGAGVLEVVEDHDGNTFRAIYTVHFRWAVYVLHCFQKKSRRGTQTPRPDVELISQRLRLARRDYEERYAKTEHNA
jgi:phage-related protein